MKILLLISILPLLSCSFQQQGNIDYKKSTIEVHEYKLDTHKEKRNIVNVHNNLKIKNEKVVLDVPLIRQNPELKYGCEVTSLAMVLQFAGVPIPKLQLADEIKKDNDPVRMKKYRDITHWGDPEQGFVGDMTGKKMGYAVFDKPIYDLMEKYLPERAINLTGKPFEQLLTHIKNGRPVVTWTTGDYRLPDRWESWKHGNDMIKTPLDLHVVVLVGYDTDHVYVNDPLSGKKAAKVDKKQFIESWIALKKRAVSYH